MFHATPRRRVYCLRVHGGERVNPPPIIVDSRLFRTQNRLFFRSLRPSALAPYTLDVTYVYVRMSTFRVLSIPILERLSLGGGGGNDVNDFFIHKRRRVLNDRRRDNYEIAQSSSRGPKKREKEIEESVRTERLVQSTTLYTAPRLATGVCFRSS